MSKRFGFLAIGILFGSLSVNAKTLSFSEVWSEISAQSPSQEASRLQVEALRIGQDRASDHWLPRVYIDGRSYQTNDPGNSFFGLLEQKSLKQSDFSPDLINHPEASTFTRGALGIDLPLYEGGVKSSQVEMLTHAANSQEKVGQQNQLEQYAQVGISYSSIAILEQQTLKLQELSKEIGDLLKSYHLGSQSNPVGYSGLLGMKSLANRINGLLGQYNAQKNAHALALQEMGLKSSTWTPDLKDLVQFSEQYFSNEPGTTTAATSFQSQALREKARAAELMAQMEKARFRPRVGLFAEGYKFLGSRDVADGYTAGVYLQWSLFDPNNRGVLNEAGLNAQAAQKYSEANRQQEKIEQIGSLQAKMALQENMKLMEDSDKLMREQSKVAMGLFKNGSMGTLQMVEVLNRRADLIAQQSEVELGFIKSAASAVTKTEFDIDRKVSKLKKD